MSVRPDASSVNAMTAARKTCQTLQRCLAALAVTLAKFSGSSEKLLTAHCAACVSGPCSRSAGTVHSSAPARLSSQKRRAAVPFSPCRNSCCQDANSRYGVGAGSECGIPVARAR